MSLAILSGDGDGDGGQGFSDPKFKYRQSAAHIRRGFDLFSNIHTLMNQGIKRHALDQNEIPLNEGTGESIM